MEILDSGTRREFESGAVRDIAEGKGRCDLLPLGIIGEMIQDSRLCDIEDYIRSGNPRCLYRVIDGFCEEHFGGFAAGMLEVAKHYEDGAKKYADRNWEKGINLHCYIDSAVRHYIKWYRGDIDEPHDRAFIWNLLGALWTQEHKPNLIDLPFKTKDCPYRMFFDDLGLHYCDIDDKICTDICDCTKEKKV